jgi:hypothetical protein
MIQLAKQTQVELRERSAELNGTFSEIQSAKQILAAVMQQQEEVDSLVREHDFLKEAEESSTSHDGHVSAHTIQSFVEKLQRAAALEDAYTQRAKALRKAAEDFVLKEDPSAPLLQLNADDQEAVKKTKADVLEMEQYFQQRSNSLGSASCDLLLSAKRAQLDELLANGRLRSDDLQRIELLLSSEGSLRKALDREAHVAHQLQQIQQQETIRGEQLRQLRQRHRIGGTPSSKDDASSPRLPGMRVHVSGIENLENDDAALQHNWLLVSSVCAGFCLLTHLRSKYS